MNPGFAAYLAKKKAKGTGKVASKKVILKKKGFEKKKAENIKKISQN